MKSREKSVLKLRSHGSSRSLCRTYCPTEGHINLKKTIKVGNNFTLNLPICLQNILHLIYIIYEGSFRFVRLWSVNLFLCPKRKRLQKSYANSQSKWGHIEVHLHFLWWVFGYFRGKCYHWLVSIFWLKDFELFIRLVIFVFLVLTIHYLRIFLCSNNQRIVLNY